MNRSRFAFALAMAALAAILVPSSLTAQITFERTYGGTDWDEGYSVQQTADDGYIISGYTGSFGAGGYDVYLIKTDATGNTIWTKTYGGTEWEEGHSVEQTTDSGYIITGYTNSFGAGYDDIYLIKTNANGDANWTRTYGGADNDEGYSVQQTADGGYIVAGSTSSFGAGSWDVYLIKTKSNGDTTWTRTFGGAWDDGGYSVQQTADDGYIITGYTHSFGAGYWDVYLIKTDTNGDTIWTRTYGGTNHEHGASVQQTADGGYIIAGHTESYGAGYWDVYLIKTDANGDTSWTRTFGDDDQDYGWSVVQTSDGGYTIASTTAPWGPGYDDIILIRTDSCGDTCWTRTFGGDSADLAYAVQQTADGGYVLAGSTTSFGPWMANFYLIKTDSLGNVAVAEPKASPPRASALSLSCEPNPFAGTTAIRLSPFAIRSSPLTLRVYDAQGRVVRSLSSVLSSPSSLTWNGTDDLGRALPSGTYFVRSDAGSEHATARIVLQR